MLINEVLDTKSMLSLESAVELLSTIMEKPMEATACANRMHVAGMRLNEGLMSCPSTSAKIKFARSSPRLLRAGIRFLTVNLPRDEQRGMCFHLCRCRCDLKKYGRLHAPDDPEPKAPNEIHISEKIFLDNAVKVVINLLHIASSSLPKHGFCDSSEDRALSLWPASAEDLFPSSLPDTIYGLDFWVEWFGIEGWEIYRLCDVLVGFHAPFARAVLQEPFAFALIRPLRILIEVMQFHSLDPKKHATSQVFFILPIQYIVEWFKTLYLQRPQETFRTMMRANADTAVPVLRGLSARLSSFTGAPWGDIRAGLEVLLSLATDSIDELRHQRSAGAREEEKWKRTPEDALLAMRAAHKGGCSNLGCPHKYEAVQTRLCGKCGILRFCGEKCQKEAWKDPVFPHKKLCAQIHGVRQELGPAAWASLWSLETQTHEFLALPATVKAMGRRGVILEIGSTLAAMRNF